MGLTAVVIPDVERKNRAVRRHDLGRQGRSLNQHAGDWLWL